MEHVYAPINGVGIVRPIGLVANDCTWQLVAFSTDKRFSCFSKNESVLTVGRGDSRNSSPCLPRLPEDRDNESLRHVPLSADQSAQCWSHRDASQQIIFLRLS